jgi:hypothetical protein
MLFLCFIFQSIVNRPCKPFPRAYNEEFVATDTLATPAIATPAIATLAARYEELVAVDTLATNNKEYAVNTALAVTKNNCDKSKKIAVEVYREKAEIEECNVEQQKADTTALTGSQDTKNDVEVRAAKKTQVKQATKTTSTTNTEALNTETTNKFKKPL